jgi:hypothetical protein
MPDTLDELSLFIYTTYDQVMLLVLIKKMDLTNPLLVRILGSIKLKLPPHASNTRPLRVSKKPLLMNQSSYPILDM